MRSRILPIVGVSAVGLLAAAAFAGSANAASPGATTAAHTHAVSSSHTTPAKKGKSCYSLTTDDTGVGVTSANYSDLPGDNSAGAADFKVKKKCTIKKFQTTGVYYNGSGPADSVDFIIYKNKKGLPGKVVNEQDNLSYTDSTGLGSIGAKVKKIKLKKGKYFASVVAEMTFSSGGQWGWELSSDTVGAMDVWQNEGGAFGVCPTWGTTLSCVGYGSDWMVTF